MGIYSRDYYRELTPSPWSFERTPVIKCIIIINVAIYLALVLFVRPPAPESARDLMKDGDEKPTPQQMIELLRTMRPVSVLQEWLELDTNKVLYKGQVWRLVTHAFCHDRLSVFHILINMILLFWFGRTLELLYGSREFLLFYLTAAVVAGLAFIALDLYTGSTIPAVGASGAVMAVMMLYTMNFPCETVCVCWFFPLEMRWLMALFVIWDLHPILLTLAGDHVFTGVGHAAHLGGLLFGFLYSWYGWRLESLGERIPGLEWRPFVRPELPQTRRTCRSSIPDSNAQEMDRLLEKISSSGPESLTAEERAALQIASERLKDRSRDSG